MDLWVTLQRTLPAPEIRLDASRWATIVAVGAGATVRRVGDELCLGELPVSRAVKDLVEAGLAEIAEVAPTGSAWASPGAPVEMARPLVAPGLHDDAIADAPRDPAELDVAVEVADVAPEAPPAPAGAPSAPRAVSGPRARRARAAASPPVASETGLFVPLDLPGHGTAPSYDDPGPEPEAARLPAPAAPTEPDAADLDELAASFPGLAHRDPTPAGPAVEPADDGEIDDEELAAQLAKLSPRAASAIRAAAAAGSGEDEAEGLDGEGPPLSRGLLLKFLSSVKS
jgi:hypothetical protein